MTSYIEQHNLLYQSQDGFRKGHSTQHAMLDIINDLQANMNQQLLSCGVFIDLRKAFDTVDHEISSTIMASMGLLMIGSHHS